MTDQEFLLTEIVIRRVLVDGADQVLMETSDSSGETPALVELLGLLRMAEDTAIRSAMGETPDEDDEEGAP